METPGPPEEPPRESIVTTIPFEFSGTAGDYFAIWIVNILLTVITLGIYSAWAKVRRLRYFYGHTALDGHRFAYLGDPWQILKGRFIAFGVFGAIAALWNFAPSLRFGLLALGLALMPALVVLSSSFNLRNMAYRNLRFSFVRSFGQAYWLLLVPLGLALAGATLCYGLIDADGPFMRAFLAGQGEAGAGMGKEDAILSLFVMMLLPLAPYLDFARVRFLVENSRYGGLAGDYGGRARQFYRLYAMSFLMFMLAMGLAIGVTTGLAALGGETRLGTPEELKSNPMAIVGLVVVFLLVFYGAAFFAYGYFKARRTNLITGQTQFAAHRLQSRMSPLRTGWLVFSNTLAAAVSLGFLVPWGKIRLLRYQLSCMALHGPALADVMAGASKGSGALGEELLDAFDFDLGL